MYKLSRFSLGFLLLLSVIVVVLGPVSKSAFADEAVATASTTPTATPAPNQTTLTPTPNQATQSQTNSVTPTPIVSGPTPTNAPAVTPTPTAQPTATPAPADPTVTPSPSVSPTPTTTPSLTITPSPTATPSPIVSGPTPTTLPSSGQVTPTPTVTPSVVQSHPIADFPNVTANQTYTAPQNGNVKVKFTSLPQGSGDLTFQTVNLSSGTAFDITSSMTNGSFAYDLTLPLPTGAVNFVVKYAPTAGELNNAQVVTQAITNNGDGTITIHGLNHFTVFVVDTNPSSVACVGAGANCYSTIQGAVDASANGDTINVQSGTYSETVNVTKQLTINGVGNPTVTKFIVWVSNVTISSINTTTVNAQPSVSLTNPIKNSNKTNVTISGSGLANANVNYTITDSGSAHSITNTGTVSSTGAINISGIDLSSFNDGSITLSLSLNDGQGHSSATVTASSFKDTTAPATPSVSMTNPINATNKTSVSFSGTGEAGTTAQYTISDGTNPSITGTVTVSGSGSFSKSNIDVSGLNDGTLTLSVNLTDSVGNTSSNGTYNSTKDTVAPTVNAGSNVSKRLSFTTSSTVNDPTPTSGIASYSWTYSGPGTITFGTASSQNTTISANTDGAYTITLTVTDNAGNSTSSHFTLNWDTVQPNVNAGVNATTNATLNRTATASDPLPTSGALTYQWSSVTVTGGTVNFGSANSLTTTIVPTADGTYTITLTATDPAGNSNSSSFTYVYDTTVPTVIAGGIVYANSQFTASASGTNDPAPSSGALTYQWTQISGPGILTFGTPNAISTTVSANQDGVYVYRFTATDPAGNSNFVNITVTWDTTRPTLSANNVIAGWYTTNQNITLSVSDALSGLKNVRFAWDSTADATHGTAFTNGVMINIPSDGVHVLNLYADDNAGNSQTFTATYRLDTVNPTTSATGSSVSWQTSVPSIVVSATDTLPGSGVSSVTYQWDAGAVVATSDTANLAATFPSDGTHTLHLLVTDVSGRTGSSTLNYMVDRVTPSTTDDVDGLWHNSTVTITFTCTDVTSGCKKVFYTIDGSTPTTSSTALTYVGTTASFQISAEGTFTVKYFSQDVAGNNEGVKSSAQVKIDLTNPVVSGVTLTNNTTGNNALVKNGDSIVLTATVTDNNQTLLTTAMITADLSALGGGAAVNPTSYNSATGIATWAAIVVSGSGNGLKTITVDSVDVANNSATQAGTTIIADNIAPTLSSINFVSSNAVATLAKATNTVTLTFTSSESIAFPSITIAGHNVVPSHVGNNWTAVYTLVAGDPQGSIVYTISSIADLAGNTASNINTTSTVIFDSVAPSTSDDVDGLWHNSAVTVHLTCTDTNGCANTYYTTDGSNPTTSSAQGTTIVLNATNVYTIKYFSVDNAGNQETVKTATNQVKIDLSSPAISGVTITNSTGNNTLVKNGNSITLTATITDNNQTLLTTAMITANLSSLGGGAAVNPISYNSATGLATWAALVVSGTGNGVVTVTVNAVDVANNPAVASSANITADNTAPVTTDNAPSGWHNSSVTVTLTCVDTNGCAATYYTTNGTTPTVASSQGTSIVLSANGTYTIKYFSVDVAGNAEGVKTAGNTVMIDITNPVVSAVTLTNTTTGNNTLVKNGDSIVLTATVTDNNQALLTTAMITANLSALGGGAAVNPTGYNPVTGIATWAAIVVSGAGNGTVTVSVNSLDIAGNSAVPSSATITADNIAPAISSSTTVSNNATVTLAKAGNTITLTFTTSEAIATPTVTIAGHNVAVVNTTGNTWKAVYTFIAADPQGTVAYTINMADIAGNPTVVNASSTVTFDSIAPTLTVVNIQSTNSSTSQAVPSDQVVITVTGSEAIQNLVFITNGKFPSPVQIAPNKWLAKTTMVNSMTEGTVVFSISYEDLAGNPGLLVTHATDGSSVNFFIPATPVSNNSSGGGSSSGGSSSSSGSAPSSSAAQPASSSPASVAAAIAQGQTGSTSLSWPKVPGATGYALVFGTSPDKLIYGASFIGGADASSYSVGFLKPGVTYYFKVIALGVKGNNAAALVTTKAGKSSLPSLPPLVNRAFAQESNTGANQTLNQSVPENVVPVNLNTNRTQSVDNGAASVGPNQNSQPVAVNNQPSGILGVISSLFSKLTHLFVR